MRAREKERNGGERERETGRERLIERERASERERGDQIRLILVLTLKTNYASSVYKQVHTLQVNGWGSLCGLREYITGERTDTCLLCCNNRIYLLYIFFHFHFCRESASSNLKPDPVWRCRLVAVPHLIFSFFAALYSQILFTIINLLLVFGYYKCLTQLLCVCLVFLSHLLWLVTNSSGSSPEPNVDRPFVLTIRRVR